MGEFVRVGKTSEIAEQHAKCYEVRGRSVAVFNLGGEFYAIDDLCTHEEGPLSEGYIENGRVECPWHAAWFDIKTGKALTEPAYEDQPVFNIRVVGDDLEVEIDD
ncbi:MAG: non-heme iron oxygenase ferredoxin subunit [Acidobacteriota bacterium]